MPVHLRMDKPNVAHPYNGLLSDHKNEWNTGTREKGQTYDMIPFVQNIQNR